MRPGRDCIDRNLDELARYASRLLVAVAVLTTVAGLPSPASAAENSVIVVNTTDDTPDAAPGDGVCASLVITQGAVLHCSLRAAIQEANRRPGEDTITFSIPGDGPHAIAAAPLPLVTESLVIDGEDENIFCPGINRACLASTEYESAAPGIEITSLSPNSDGSGLTFDESASGSVIRWVSLTNWRWGIHLWSDDTTIEKSFIGARISPVDEALSAAGNLESGISVAGTPSGSISNLVIRDNFIAANKTGVFVNGGSHSRIEDNLVGGLDGNDEFANDLDGVVLHNTVDSTVGPDNVLVGNGLSGVRLDLNTARNKVIGNHIGLSPWGTALASGNDGAGVSAGGFGNVIGGPLVSDRNVVSGNGMGVSVHGPMHIEGNYIGTDRSGSVAVPNRYSGIDIQNASRSTIQKNLISGNGFDGIRILGYLSDATGHVMTNNLIGVDATGSKLLGNGRAGISISTEGSKVETKASAVIGQSGAGNIIGGNDDGINIAGPGATGTTIVANAIGSDLMGAKALPNGTGIVFREGANGNTIGGHGLGNTLAFNDGPGVFVTLSSGSKNLISSNAMFGNRGLGIDLAHVHPLTNSHQGVTPNDAGDQDSGPNEYQNFPLVTRATSSVISGSLSSAPDSSYTIEIFSSPSCDPRGYGEGRTFLSSTKAETGTDGTATFEIPATPRPGDIVTATATDSLGNTSEFSSCAIVVEDNSGSVDPSPSPSQSASVDPGVESPRTFLVNSVGDEPDFDLADGKCDVLTGPGEAICTLRAALQESNGSSDRDTITFAIPGIDRPTIIPAISLPSIVYPVTLDASDQCIDVAAPCVQIDGRNSISEIDDATLNDDGSEPYVINVAESAPGTLIEGLSVTNAPSGAIAMRSANSIVRTSYIGVTPVGEPGSNKGVGIRVLAPNNIIGGVAVNGNVVSNNGRAGIWVGATGVDASGTTVLGNLIGTDPQGTAPQPNDYGIVVRDAHNVIGGTTDGTGNLVSGNTVGILLSSPRATDNFVQGNRIGTDVTGAAAVPNNDGIVSSGAAGNVIGGLHDRAGNLISGNDFSGVGIYYSHENLVAGNKIGTDASGASALPNGGAGIRISYGSRNTIGGSERGAGNLISGNRGDDCRDECSAGTGAGITIYGWAGGGIHYESVGNRVSGNLIGTDLTGQSLVPGSRAGINVYGARRTIIGEPGAPNVISGATHNGIALYDAIDTSIRNNFIGTDEDANDILGVGGDGIKAFWSSQMTDEGFTKIASNVIDGSNDSGISVENARRVRITGNRITGSGALPIDLDADGETPNDPADTDEGSNLRQNFPVVDEVVVDGDGVAVSGTLESSPETTFTVELFASQECAEGKPAPDRALGTTSVTTDAAGLATFEVNVGSDLGVGHAVLATATDPFGNTSEVGPCEVPTRPTESPPSPSPSESASGDPSPAPSESASSDSGSGPSSPGQSGPGPAASSPSPTPTATVEPTPTPSPNPTPAETSSEDEVGGIVFAQTSVSARYRENREVFIGRVTAEHPSCITGRIVKIYKKRSGADRLVGRVFSGEEGKWRFRAGSRKEGRFYARTPSTTRAYIEGELRCTGARSEVIHLDAT